MSLSYLIYPIVTEIGVDKMVLKLAIKTIILNSDRFTNALYSCSILRVSTFQSMNDALWMFCAKIQPHLADLF